MFKLTFIVSFMILGTLIFAKYPNMNCNSCGDECKRACGSRQFKTCCYNYLRKKRIPETIMVLSPVANLERANLPFFVDTVAQDVMEAHQHRDYPEEDLIDMQHNNKF